MQNPLKTLSQTFPPEAFRDLKVRLLLLCVFGASVALAWWSINRLPAWETKLQLQSTKIAQLESNILELELRWNPQDAERIASRFKLSQEQLLAGPEEFIRWQTDLKRRTDQLAVSINAGLAQTQACPLPGKRFSIYSATLEMRPIPPGLRTNSPYVRLLNFARDLTSEKKRVDLVELAASGSSNSVSQAKMDLQLWSLENLP